MSRNWRLTYLNLREKIPQISPVAVVVVGFIVVGIGLLSLQSGVGPANYSAAEGTVLSWSRNLDETGSPAVWVFLQLDTGERVTATAQASGRAPLVGETLSLTKKTTSSGRTIYLWNSQSPISRDAVNG
ncbi:hypothetical protein [Roseibium aggregatum]|uniref:Uncharacterized protein n=1 Tax=Roseibium aggregatum TaxID=187304 RepID=A0A926NZA9_9HYPH|nr:hypothetical protein [Roseibium aggregatum]MBD1547051.1 hypothetical protein [Roseibium aggregatum]